jgi:hypothetical protein
MDKHVLAAAVRLNETITLRGVEPLHCPGCHFASPFERALSIDALRVFSNGSRALGHPEGAGPIKPRARRNDVRTERLRYWSVARYLERQPLASHHPPGKAHRYTRDTAMGLFSAAAAPPTLSEAIRRLVEIALKKVKQ